MPVHVHGDPGLTSAYVDSIESWMVLTIVSGLPMLWAMALFMQFGRPYVMRVLNRLGLRFGADVWWLSYVLIRDFVMIAAFAFSFIFLVPDLARDQAQPLFGPLSVVILFWALVVRLTRDADDNPRDFALVGVLTSVAAALFFVPMVFGVKAMGADENAPYARFLVSSTNWTWSKWMIVAGWVGLIGTAGYIFNFFMIKSLRHMPTAAKARTSKLAESHRPRSEEPKPIPEPSGGAQT